MLSFGQIEKYDYITGKEILHPDQIRVIEQPKFTCSPLEKNWKNKHKKLKVKVKRKRNWRAWETTSWI